MGVVGHEDVATDEDLVIDGGFGKILETLVDGGRGEELGVVGVEGYEPERCVVLFEETFESRRTVSHAAAWQKW
jgi:hypothetical protein